MQCCSSEAIGMHIQELQKKAEPVEKVIKEHPIPSVLIGVGIGVLIGALAMKYFGRRE